MAALAMVSRLRRLLRIGELLLEIGEPLLRLVQAQILDQHGLHEVIGRVRLLNHGLMDQRVGFRVFRLPAGTFEAREQGRDQIAFLGNHRRPSSEKRRRGAVHRAECGE